MHAMQHADSQPPTPYTCTPDEHTPVSCCLSAQKLMADETQQKDTLAHSVPAAAQQQQQEQLTHTTQHDTTTSPIL
jgi:hypothetical protein